MAAAKKSRNVTRPIKTKKSAMVPDRAAMERFISSLGGQDRDEPTSVAQDLIFDAWDLSSRAKRVALAHKALAVSPLCADAYALLAMEEAKDAAQALDYYEKAVQAGELLLGQEGFEDYAEHFWGFLETRPYMRARAGLAMTLCELDRVDEAIPHFNAMLELNPNDNQGIRYLLASNLLKLDRTEELKTLIDQYDGDGGTEWSYTRALLAFRDGDPNAEAVAKSALGSNKHVPAILSGKKPKNVRNDGYITLGGEDEALSYVEDNLVAWLNTDGAVDWLVGISKSLRRK